MATPDRPLAAALLDAADWFDEALRVRLAEAGWPRLSRNQSLVFPLLDAAGTSQSEVARRLGITRQSAHALLRDLEQLGVLEQRPDPADGRARRVHLTDRGQRLARDAGVILRALEVELADRIGAARVDALRIALGQPWGPPPA